MGANALSHLNPNPNPILNPNPKPNPNPNPIPVRKCIIAPSSCFFDCRNRLFSL